MGNIRITPGFREQLLAQTLAQLRAEKEREELGKTLFSLDICDWAERHFYIPNPEGPIRLPLHQKAILRYFFTRRDNGHFPFKELIYSTIKKSGKSTIAGVAGRYIAETQTRYGEIYCIGNDLDQAKDRSFKEIRRSIMLTPGYNMARDVMPGQWNVEKLSMQSLRTGSVIKAVAVDAKGEAGGQQSLTIWTELWGAETTEAKRFWDEMPPIQTVPDSMRLVETYAGYDGESELLQSIYNTGMEGRQLTAGELAASVCREDRIGESFQDFVDCWQETQGNPEILIPIWINEAASMGMYWDSGLVARRMPWQIGDEADEDFRSKEVAARKPEAYRRLYMNEWVGAESALVPMELWDACGNVHDIPLLADGDKTPIVVSADAAVTQDCFGIVAVSRCPNDPKCVDIRAIKKWDPKENGGKIDLSEPDAFLRVLPQVNNVVQICYDSFQMEKMAQDIQRDGVCWIEKFQQASERTIADSQLVDMIMQRQVHFSHSNGCRGGAACVCNMAALREHISNANAKLQPNEDSKLRIVKKASGRKIDLAVALSMAVARCLYLRLA